jgi:hypothetical protein
LYSFSGNNALENIHLYSLARELKSHLPVANIKVRREEIPPLHKDKLGLLWTPPLTICQSATSVLLYPTMAWQAHDVPEFDLNTFNPEKR